MTTLAPPALCINHQRSLQAFHPAPDLAPLSPVIMPADLSRRKMSIGAIQYVGILWVRGSLCVLCCSCCRVLMQSALLSGDRFMWS